jgi:predicted RNase H-like HicB family nuclease
MIAMRYKIVLEPSDEGYAASVLGLPGCHSQGVTEQEALHNISDAIREYLEVVDDLSETGLVREIEIEA